VKPKAARRQLEAERQAAGTTTPWGGVSEPLAPGEVAEGETGAGVMSPASVPHRRFHGSVNLDPVRVGAAAGRIAQEVIAHLAALPGAQVRVTLEIEATVPNGIPDRVVCTVTENCRTLRFTSHGFERE